MTITLTAFDTSPQTVAEFFALTDRNRAYLRTWLPWLDFVKTPSDTQNFLHNALKTDHDQKSLNFFIKQGDKIIGTIGLRGIGDDNGSHLDKEGIRSALDKEGVRSALVGYWLSQDYAGQGITSWALGQLITLLTSDYAELGVQAVILRCNPDNIASNKVAQKNNFIYSHTLPDAQKLYGRWEDLNVYYKPV